MFEGLKSALTSRKFWTTVVGSAVVTGLSFCHVPEPVIFLIGSLFGVNVAAQGYADGKKMITP